MGARFATDVAIGNLHALKHAEGMGKRAFSPQGVGSPVLIWEPLLSHMALLLARPSHRRPRSVKA
jgi:hypothetical protein